MKIEANSIEELLDKAESKRDGILVLNDLIQSIDSTLNRWLLTSDSYTILGYGKIKHHYNYPLIGITPQKHYISLYVIGKKDGKLLTDIYRRKLGKVKVGKSCISIRNIKTVNMEELRNLLVDSIAWNQEESSQ